MLKTQIRQIARKIYPEIISARRYLHQYPEVSFHEKNTSAFIRSELQKAGLKPHSIAGYGIFALIEGKNNKDRTVALRADMDALPILETNTHDFVSKNKGVMHACGHDVHAASLLGVAKIIFQLRDELEGNIKILFQPAEEKIPGGAKAMIEEGILDNPVVNILIGQHVEPCLPAGSLGFKSGNYMASSDEIVIHITGKGGHAAMPWKINDTVLAASQLIVNLQQVASRHAPATIPTVLSFGKIETPSGALNVIPDEVIVYGTFRTFDESWRLEAHKKIKQIAAGIAATMSVGVEVEILKGYPALYNNEQLTQQLKTLAVEYLGKEHVVELDQRMTSEDFSYFSQKKPSVFYRLGTANPAGGTVNDLHTANFDVDEKSLLTGMEYMAYAAIKLLDS